MHADNGLRGLGPGFSYKFAKMR